MSKGSSAAPPIANGSWVAWDGGKGRVDLIVANGKVPGIDGDVEGTEKTPAARVVIYENGKATRKKLGMSVAKLRRTPPLTGQAQKKSAGQPSGAGDGLVERLAAHEEAVEDYGLPNHARITGRAVKAVYDRGVKSWPGGEVTSLSAQEWALGRVDHFIKAAAGTLSAEEAGNDTDQLDPEHPLATGPEEGADDVDGDDDGPVDPEGKSYEEAVQDGGDSLFGGDGTFEPEGAGDWAGSTAPDDNPDEEATEPVDNPAEEATETPGEPSEETTEPVDDPTEEAVEGKVLVDPGAMQAELDAILASAEPDDD